MCYRASLETANEWQNLAVDVGHALADHAFKVPMLERGGARPCACMTAQGVPSAATEAALDAMALSFDARLMAFRALATAEEVCPICASHAGE